MAVEISDAFISQFESEVHVAYQRMGSKFRNTVRTKNGIKGKDTTFQKVGTGVAATKTRHGNIPTMNITHDPVLCTLSDHYAADYVDELDELKTNIDERGVVAQAAAGALGRKTDELILTAMETSSNTTVHGSAALTQGKINTVFEYFGNNDVPDDGQRYWAIAPQQWTDLLGITAFSNADYVGSDELPYKAGMMAKRWMGFMWFPHSGLTKASTTRTTVAYHKTAIGHAIGKDVSTRWDWVPEKGAMFMNSNLSQGACLIDTIGVYLTECTES